MARWSRAGAIVGGIVWLLLFLTPLPGDETIALIARLLLFAVLVITPLALPLVAPPARRAALPYCAALMIQPFAAALVVISFFVSSGIAAALLAAGWLLVTGLVALFGLLRFLARRNLRADELCIDAGLIYLPVGAVWLLFNRLGINPLGFGDTIVLLTAVHFHYAGFAAPILAGLLGRRIAAARPVTWPLFRLVAAGIISGIALMATGITLARFTPLVEVAAAGVFAASLLGLAALALLVVVPGIGNRFAQGLLAVSAMSLVVTMLLAGAYAIGGFVGAPVISIPHMVRVHGVTNALGFVLCGLLAWTLLTESTKDPKDTQNREPTKDEEPALSCTPVGGGAKGRRTKDEGPLANN